MVNPVNLPLLDRLGRNRKRRNIEGAVERAPARALRPSNGGCDEHGERVTAGLEIPALGGAHTRRIVRRILGVEIEVHVNAVLGAAAEPDLRLARVGFTGGVDAPRAA